MNHLTQLQLRARWKSTHDIYGNDEAAQLIIDEMRAKREEHLRDVAAENRRAWLADGGNWLSPLGIDEMINPLTHQLYDYGRLPDSSEYARPPKLHHQFDDR